MPAIKRTVMRKPSVTPEPPKKPEPVKPEPPKRHKIAICERCNVTTIFKALGGIRVWTCPGCACQYPPVSSKKRRDHTRFAMSSFIAGLVFLMLGNLDETPFEHVPEPDDQSRRLRAKYMAAITKAARASERLARKRKRNATTQNEDAKLYNEIAAENDKLVEEFNAEATRKLEQDPNFQVSNCRQVWKLLGAFTVTTGDKEELFAFGLGPESHLGPIHAPQGKTVKKFFWPAIFSAKSLTLYTHSTEPHTEPHTELRTTQSTHRTTPSGNS
jgi:hypothetical protein